MPLTKIQSLGITDGTIVNADINASAAIAASKLSGAGISEADQWRITTNFTADGVLTDNWERVDTNNFGVLGTGMTQSSGIFSFPSTGYYSIHFKTYGYATGLTFHISYIQLTLNNSTYDTVSVAADSNKDASVGYVGSANFHIVKITDIANQKIRFELNDSSAGVTYESDTNASNTTAQFIKLAGL